MTPIMPGQTEVPAALGKRVLARDLPAHAGERVTVAGWLHRKRQLKSVTFLILRDRTGLAQVVLTADQAAAAVGADLPEETVLAVTGLVTASPRAPGGAEVTEPVLTALSEPAEPPPFDLYRPAVTAGLPTVLDHAPTTLRHKLLRAGFEIAAASVAGFRAAMDDHGFTEIQTPKIVRSATESGANVFALDYFGQRAFLAQSPQFYKQAMVGVFERVYETGPVFRAEPHDTARHLAQYASLDAEFGFITDHRDVMTMLREAITGMVAAVGTRARDAVDVLRLELPAVPAHIPEVRFTDAQELIAAGADSPTSPPPTSAGSATGRFASTAPISSS
jgi:nondiscriminating aspartyl-tRNA synthetase